MKWVMIVLAMTVLMFAFQAQAGTCLDSRSTDGKVNVLNSESMNIVGAFTFEAWVWENRSSVVQEYIYKWYPGGRSYFLGSENGRLRMGVGLIDGSLENRMLILSNTLIKPQTWTHVAGVYDGSQVTLYVNGIEDVSMAMSGSHWATSSPVYIGGTPKPSFEGLQGMIDEVRISNVARYSSTFSVSGTEFAPDVSTLLLMHFNEGTGSVAGNDGFAAGDGQLLSGASWATGAPLQPIPEPATLSVLALGGIALRMRSRTKRSV